MSTTSVAAFWAVSIMLIVVPGPDWAFTIGAALRARTVLPAVAGLIVGYAAMTAVVAAGVGAFVARSPVTLSTLGLVGGAYLVWQGVRTVAKPARPLDPTQHAGTSPPAKADSHWGTLARGVGVSGLNPKALLLFLALLPQFTEPQAAWPLAVQIAVLGLIFTATCGVFYLALGTFTKTSLHARPIAARLVGCLSGTGMIVIGALLVLEQLLA